MTAVVIIDPTLNGTTVNPNYTTPGSLLNLGVPMGQAPGSTTGTLVAKGSAITTYVGDTYTIIAANTIQDLTRPMVAGVFTGSGNITILPAGFQPTKIEAIDWTGVVKWEWMLGAPATDSLKVVTAGTETADTGSGITVTTDLAGNCIVAFAAALAVSTHVVSFRIEG